MSTKTVVREAPDRAPGDRSRTDINRDSLWPILAEHGLRPVAQVSLDDVWSTMRFRPLKPGEAPFRGGAA